MVTKTREVFPGQFEVGFGVRLHDNQQTGITIFRDNNFLLDGGRFGFFGNNITRSLFDEVNVINWAGNANGTYGIQLTGGLQPVIKGTLIQNSDPTGFTESFGIDVQNVAAPRIQCNTTANWNLHHPRYG